MKFWKSKHKTLENNEYTDDFDFNFQNPVLEKEKKNLTLEENEILGNNSNLNGKNSNDSFYELKSNDEYLDPFIAAFESQKGDLSSITSFEPIPLPKDIDDTNIQMNSKNIINLVKEEVLYGGDALEKIKETESFNNNAPSDDTLTSPFNFSNKVAETLTAPLNFSNQGEETLSAPIDFSNQGNETLTAPLDFSHKEEETLSAPIDFSNQGEETLTAPLQFSNQEEETLSAPIDFSNHGNETLTAPLQFSNQEEETLSAPIDFSNHGNETLTEPLDFSHKEEETLSAPIDFSNQGEETLTAPLQFSNQEEETLSAPIDISNQGEETLSAPQDFSKEFENLGEKRETINSDFERNNSEFSADEPLERINIEPEEKNNLGRESAKDFLDYEMLKDEPIFSTNHQDDFEKEDEFLPVFNQELEFNKEKLNENLDESSVASPESADGSFEKFNLNEDKAEEENQGQPLINGMSDEKNSTLKLENESRFSTEENGPSNLEKGKKLDFILSKKFKAILITIIITGLLFIILAQVKNYTRDLKDKNAQEELLKKEDALYKSDLELTKRLSKSLNVSTTMEEFNKEFDTKIYKEGDTPLVYNLTEAGLKGTVTQSSDKKLNSGKFSYTNHLISREEIEDNESLKIKKGDDFQAAVNKFGSDYEITNFDFGKTNKSMLEGKVSLNNTISYAWYNEYKDSLYKVFTVEVDVDTNKIINTSLQYRK